MSMLTESLETGICARCRRSKPDIDEQYSFGYYAGVMCTDCAIKGYRDSCGHGEPQGDPSGLDDYGNDGEY